jgi:porin
MKRSMVVAVIIFLFGVAISTKAVADEASPSRTYSGDFWTRTTLSGDWGGVRNDLFEKGVAFDINLTQVGIGVVGGGKDTGWEYGGRGDITLNVDTQKLGLWPGGFLMVEAEGNFGNSVNLQTGAIMPVNPNQIFPTPGGDEFNIPAITFTQFLSPYGGITVGKMDTTAGDPNEFAHGKGDTQFFNLALNFNPATFLPVPYSTLGAGIVVLPTKDPNAAVISVIAVSADGQANRSGFDTLFKGNMTYTASGRARTDFFGLTGHQLVGGIYSAKNFTSLNQNLRFIIENGSIEEKGNSWCFYYNFDQYVYEPKKGQGIGIFGRFGITDGNPNPIHHFYSIGLGGKGLVPGRALDTFGLGSYYVDINSPKFTGPIHTREPLRDEYGIEVYYNAAITPWMKLTPDIQVIRPAQKRRLLGQGIFTASARDIDTTTIVGLRLQLIF